MGGEEGGRRKVGKVGKRKKEIKEVTTEKFVNFQSGDNKIRTTVSQKLQTTITTDAHDT